MRPLDAQTLLVMGALLAAMAVAVTSRLGHDQRRPPGALQWSLHYAAVTAGLAAFGVGAAAPDWLSDTLAHTAISLATLLYLDGISRFVGGRPVPRRLYAALAVWSVLWIEMQSEQLHLVFHGLLTLVVYGVAAHRLWHRSALQAPAQRRLALIAGAHAAVVGAITLVASLGPSPPSAESGAPTSLALLLEGTVVLCLTLVTLAQVVGERDHRDACDRAEHDPLTNLLNRRGFEAEATRLLAVAPGPVCVAMADLDRFKHVNDRFGHPAGDDALRAVTRIIQAELRATDLVGRVGGEEFAFLLLARCEVARGVLERVRRRVAATPLPALGEARLTISLGAVRCDDGENLRAALARADQALYEAKRGGRDMLVLTPPPQAVSLATSSS